MTGIVPRLRMFAGPNGSGKSSLIDDILPEQLRGVYLNADDLERSARDTRVIDLVQYGVEASAEQITAHFSESALLRTAGLLPQLEQMSFEDGRIGLNSVEMNAYFASVAVDLTRHRLLCDKRSFTFETVMSARAKVEFLDTARANGYRTYLYYVATEDPEINVSRVRNRVSLGGHPVPEDKIIARYWRSLGLLKEAVRRTNRAYIFDNSAEEGDHTWLAEITEGTDIEIRAPEVPSWFRTALLESSRKESD